MLVRDNVVGIGSADKTLRATGHPRKRIWRCSLKVNSRSCRRRWPPAL
jgi:hypothetical protein